MNAILAAGTASRAPDEHVRVYLRIKLREAKQTRVARETADRYDAAVAGQVQRVAAIQASQALLVEPVRLQRDIEPATWRDPEQQNKFSRKAEKVVGFRRIDELVRLKARGTITERHLAAGTKLRDDYEMGELGARPGTPWAEVRSSGDGATPSQVRLDALKRYREAMQAVGPTQSSILVHVALNNGTVTKWAERRAMSLSRATGYLEAAFDRLADHYGGDIELVDLQRASEMA